MFGSAESAFPDRALVQFTVAHDDEDTAAALLHARCQGQADADRQTVAERTGRGLDARDMTAFRMAAKPGARAALLLQFIDGEEAFIGQQGVLREAAMAFAENAAVALWIARIRRIDSQDVVIKDAQDLDQREGGADMAATAAFERVDHQAAQVLGSLVHLQPIDSDLLFLKAPELARDLQS